MLNCVNDWSSSLDSNIPLDVIYIDFAKAFDTVSHSILLAKLQNFGCSHLLLKWFDAWLCHRTQFVTINKVSSSSVPITSGVPQGSVLGPTLFVIFINDLPHVVKYAKLFMYADDVILCLPIRSRDDFNLLISDLLRLFSWSSTNLLTISLTKCQVLHIGSNSNPKHNYVVNGNTILAPTIIRDLRVLIDSDLTFIPHINSIVTEASVRLGILTRAFRSKSVSFQMLLYKTFVRPLLEYCPTVWSPYCDKYSSLIESVQHKFTRYLSCNVTQCHILIVANT